MASNQLYFALDEMLIPLIIALFSATIIVVMLWAFLRDWHRPAAITAVITIVFFGYGHIQTALDSRIDERLLFSSVSVLAAGAVYAALRSTCWVKRSAQMANVTAAALIVFSVVSLILEASRSGTSEYSADPAQVEKLTSHLFPEGVPDVRDKRPDIYYIILDEYGRHDLLNGFDNTQFIGELERRGFYIAKAATTNYSTTVTSLASALNMAYMEGIIYKGHIAAALIGPPNRHVKHRGFGQLGRRAREPDDFPLLRHARLIVARHHLNLTAAEATAAALTLCHSRIASCASLKRRTACMVGGASIVTPSIISYAVRIWSRSYSFGGKLAFCW